MAYNIQSLITILQQILNPEQSRWIVDENKPQLESLLEKAESLQQILEKSPFTEIGNLESQIRDVVYKAEDIIEYHMVRQMRSNPHGVRFTFITPYLQRVIQQLDSATAKVVKLVKWKTMLTGSSSSSGASFSHDLTADVLQATQELESLKLVEVEGKKKPSGGPLSSSKKDLVGVEADLMQLKDRLTNMQRKLEIIPITGMGGIGKTTLARKLYEDPDIVSRFDYRGWATISQDYNMRDILLSILRCIGKECGQHNDELKDILYRSLYGRRYMIVLDDIWSTKIWDEIRMYFPNNNNGSRILITTRESGVAKYVAGSSSLHHDMQLLSKSESWNLLRQIVFVEEDCPDHVFQEIGKKIAGDCGGLPLAIKVIGGLLSKIERSKDAWEKIGNDVIAAIAESDEQGSSILSLSYNNLPNHLKPCFLYMGALHEDYEIKGSRLICMWVGEGFVRSNGDKSLEEEAEDCLKSLVERNLFMVSGYKYGKSKCYSMHDLLRDLCIRKCDEDKFLHVKNGAFSNPRRVSVGTSDRMEAVNASAESMSLTRSFIGIGFGFSYGEIPWGAFSALRLVRVLDIMDMELKQFPAEIFELVNLRFLAFSCLSSVPRGISRLWHLQILIAEGCGFDDASEIWELPELRYLKTYLELDDIEEMINIVKKKLLKLQTIQRVVSSVIMRDFFKSIPNIKNLGIEITDLKTSMEFDLSHLHKLETLRCGASFSISFSPRFKFPCNIRKLFLDECVINREALRTLCGLHKLEVLKINWCKFQRENETCDRDEFESKEERCEEEWEATDGDEFEREEEETSSDEDRELTADGDESESEEEETSDQEWVLADGDEFSSLHFLSLERLGIVRWIADETNFPRLRHLYIRNCKRLEEIPSGIGEIPTLQLIHLKYCNPSLVASAEQIVEEQQSEYDNYDLKLSIISYDK